MNIINKLKNLGEKVPESLGQKLAWFPFSLRLGLAYKRNRRNIENMRKWSTKRRRRWVTDRLRDRVRFAYKNVPFYRHIYQERGYHPSDIRTIEDFRRLPVITKEQLKKSSIAERAYGVSSAMKVNTGGTSGEPLDFYLTRQDFAREWAHMHTIWERLGYEKTDCKLTFRGQNLGNELVVYNAVHNEYLVNAYAERSAVAEEILRVAGRVNIRFLHGYPSEIYEFACFFQRNCPRILQRLSKTLKGVLLGSEYPAKVYRETIENVFEAKSLSWYGHSEMAILAPERERYVFEPFWTYGFAEAIPTGKGTYRLVGTSYGNTASPFIRYDTGDEIEPVEYSGNILRAFRITKGRVGEFIEDENGQRISLTALIFGRHHPLFEKARFVQVYQELPGQATLLVTLPHDQDMTSDELHEKFDSTNVAINFEFETRNEPVKTESGKVPLLVRDLSS